MATVGPLSCTPGPAAALASLAASLPGRLSHMLVTALRTLITVAAAGAAATVAALAASGAPSAAAAASHPALLAALAAAAAAHIASLRSVAEARRLRTALAEHSETLAGIERGVSILYSSLDNLSHLHLETSRRTASLSTSVDVALAVLLEDKYDQFRAAVAAAEAAARQAAAARLWHGGDGPARPHSDPSPLAGLSPEARAAAVADRLGRLGCAAGALATTAWVVRAAADGRLRRDGRRRGGLLALPAPAGTVCQPVPPAARAEGDTVVVLRPPSATLWRLVAAAAGALKTGRVGGGEA